MPQVTRTSPLRRSCPTAFARCSRRWDMIIDWSSTVASGVSARESSRLRPLAIHRSTDRPMMRDPMKCTAAAMRMTKAMNRASVQKLANQSQKGWESSAGGVVSSARLITLEPYDAPCGSWWRTSPVRAPGRAAGGPDGLA